MALFRTGGGGAQKPMRFAVNGPSRIQLEILKEVLDDYKYIQIENTQDYTTTWDSGLATAVRFYVDSEGTGTAHSLTATPVEISTLNVSSYLFFDEQTTPRFCIKLFN